MIRNIRVGIGHVVNMKRKAFFSGATKHVLLPKEFGEKISSLFKTGEHKELISLIDNSPHKSNPHLLEFRDFVESLRNGQKVRS